MRGHQDGVREAGREVLDMEPRRLPRRRRVVCPVIGADVGTDALELAGQLSDQPKVAEAWKSRDPSAAQTKEITKAAKARRPS